MIVVLVSSSGNLWLFVGMLVDVQVRQYKILLSIFGRHLLRPNDVAVETVVSTQFIRRTTIGNRDFQSIFLILVGRLNGTAGGRWRRFQGGPNRFYVIVWRWLKQMSLKGTNGYQGLLMTLWPIVLDDHALTIGSRFPLMIQRKSQQSWFTKRIVLIDIGGFANFSSVNVTVRCRGDRRTVCRWSPWERYGCKWVGNSN